MKPPACKYLEFNTEIDLGKYERPDIGLDDHGLLMIFGSFDYGSGNQGLGYIVDTVFLEALLKVFGVYILSECNGKYAWVEHNRGKIFRILSADGKREFDIEKMCRKNVEDATERAKQKLSKKKK